MRRLLLLLIPLFILLSSCNTGDETVERTFSFAALADSLKAYDSVRIVVKYPSGDSDVVFTGKVASASDLADRPAPHYSGGAATIEITGFDAGGEAVYEIRKSYDGKQTQATKPVILPDSRLVTDGKDIVIKVGQTAALPAVRILPADLADTSLSWTSSNTDAFLVDNGTLKGWGAGTGNLVVTLRSDTSKRASFFVTVLDRARAPESLQLSPRKLQLAAHGSPSALTLRIVPNSAGAAVHWGVVDGAVASVTQTGVVAGLQEGKTQVWAQSAEDGNVADTIDVEVSRPVQVTGVVFLRDSLELFVGGAAESLGVAVKPAQADQAVSLQAADSAVARVSGGRVTGLAEGRTTVTARSLADTSMTASVPIIVRPAQSVSNVDVTPGSLTLYTGGGDGQLAAAVTQTGSNGRVIWRVDRPGVATVDAAGKVSPLAPGKCEAIAVSLVDSTKRDGAEITVKRDMPLLDVGLADTAVTVGKSVSFHPVVSQEYGGIAEFRWDLDGDGKWDGADTALKDLSFTYGSEKVYQAKFRVRDTEGNDTTVIKILRAGKGALVVILKPQAGLYTNKTVYDSVIWTVDGARQDLYTSEPLDKEGANTITRTYKDPVSGATSSASVTIYRDTQAPNKPVEAGTGWSGNLVPTWRWTSGGGGGAGVYRYHFGGEVVSTDPEISDTSYDAPADLKEGTQTLYVQERDKAFNWSASAKLVIKIDTTPPPAPAAASDHQALSNHPRPAFKWVSTAKGGGAAGRYRVATDTSKGFQPVAVDSAAYAPDKDLREGWDTLFVQERDSAGNWSPFGAVRVLLDFTGPGAPSFGAFKGMPLNTTAPKWTWKSGGNGGIGLYRWKLDDSAMADGAVELRDTAYAVPVAGPLSQGGHAFYLQERDSAGNWSATVSSKVLLARREAVGTGLPTGVGSFALAAGPGNVLLAAYNAGSTKATVSRLEGGAWKSLGTGPECHEVGSMAISKTGDIYLACMNAIAKNGTFFYGHVYRYSGSSWSRLGDSVQVGDYGNGQTFKLALDGAGKVYRLGTTFGFNVSVFADTGWKKVGAGVPGAFEYHGGLAFAASDAGKLYVSMRWSQGFNPATYGTSVFQFPDTAWSAMGGNLINGTQVNTALALDAGGVLHAAYSDPNLQGKAMVKKWNGSDWGLLGSGGAGATGGEQMALGVTPGGMPVLAYATTQTATSPLNVVGYSGGAWVSMGMLGTTSKDAAPAIVMGSDGIPYVGFLDANRSLGLTIMPASFDP
jgi:hypothetical protein